MGLFVDLLHVPASVTNDALDGIYKALSDGHGGDGIWNPHDSPLVQRLIELFTERGLMRLEAVRTQFLAWQSGVHHNPKAPLVQAPGLMTRWNAGELQLVKLYMESLPASAWSLGDHMMAIEYVIQTYLPAGDLVTEADWLATKAALLGKVQANMEKPPTLKQADAILESLPSAIAGATGLNPAASSALMFASNRAAENVRSLSESVRHRMRVVVADHLEQMASGPAGGSLETKLFDEFASLNRDWRRIAITEAGEAQLQGFIASLKPGATVKRVEQYEGACAFCRRIDGTIATVVTPDHPNKNPETMVWPGKNNIGRSASPKKRVGNLLVEREPEERWWLPAGLAHPHCRGRWVLVSDPDESGDPDFAAVLRGILGQS